MERKLTDADWEQIDEELRRWNPLDEAPCGDPEALSLLGILMLEVPYPGHCRVCKNAAKDLQKAMIE